MRMYPSYKLSDVLDEYAITFFTMLAEGYRYEYRKYQMLASIVSLPHMDEGDRTTFLRQLEWATQEPGGILNPSDDYSGIEDIRKML